MFVREKQLSGSADMDSLITGYHNHNESNPELADSHPEYG